MATEQDIIREFLVSLGFKVDKKGLKDFTGGVEQATKGVVKMVAAIEAGALSIGAGVAAMASHIESLGFAAQRAGASGNNMRALAGAAQDFGISADTALGSVQALKRAMDTNPGNQAWIRSFGVHLQDAQGHARDTVDVLTDLGQALHAKFGDNWAVESQIGQRLGIDYNLLKVLMDPAFAQRLQQIRAYSENNGFDKAAVGAHEFMKNLRQLRRTAEDVGIQIEASLQQKIGPQLEHFTKWAEQNAPMIADRVSDVANTIVDMGNKVAPAIEWVVDEMERLDKSTDGMSTKIIGYAAAFRILGGAAIIKGITSLAGALGGLASKAGTVGTAIEGSGLGALLTRLLPGATVAGGVAMALMPSELHDDTKDMDAIRSGKTKFIDTPNRGPIPVPRQGLPLNETNYGGDWADDHARREAMAMNFFMKMGWSKAQASGIVANLNQESSLRETAAGDHGAAFGIAQWHKERQAAFAQWAGHDMGQSTLMEQLRFVDYELRHGAERRAGALLAAASNANQAGEIVSRYYERPAAADLEAARRGAAAVTLNSAPVINISGVSGGANDTARAVREAMETSTMELIRNMAARHG